LSRWHHSSIALELRMHAIWYFDFISPFAYLQWRKIRTLAARVRFEFRPILFAGLLQKHGQKGPAEIPGKREFTYRFVLWQARREGQRLRFPPAHPFNPIAALRLCVACGATPEAIDAIFAWIWRDGQAGDSIESLRPLAHRLGLPDPEAALGHADVRQALMHNFDAALRDNIYGVPSIVCRGEVFWGNDATPMFEEFLDDPNLFGDPEMRRIALLPEGIRRPT
jgi:2-hydroxychromene-2-carboxylate isomerase